MALLNLSGYNYTVRLEPLPTSGGFAPEPPNKRRKSIDLLIKYHYFICLYQNSKLLPAFTGSATRNYAEKDKRLRILTKYPSFLVLGIFQMLIRVPRTPPPGNPIRLILFWKCSSKFFPGMPPGNTTFSHHFVGKNHSKD